MTGYPRQDGTGMSDLNGFPIDGGFSDFFDQPGDPNSSGAPTRTDGDPGEFPEPFASRLPVPGHPGLGGPRGPIPNPFDTQGGTSSGPRYPDDYPPGYPIGLTYSNFFGRSSSPLGSDPASRIINGSFTDDPDYYLIAPKRTKWFNNILQARQKSSKPQVNPNSGNPAPGNNGGPNPPINPNPI